MLRAAVSTVGRRAIQRSFRGVPACAAPCVNFHASVRQQEDAAVAPEAPSKGGLFGTGLSEWFALPVGLAAAVPILNYELYLVNEETQLVAVFIAFCVTVYTQGGDAIYNLLDERAQEILKEQNEAEDKVIQVLEEYLESLQAQLNIVTDFEAIHAIRAKTYENLNAAGAIKPQHDLKAQVERVLAMIAQEEANMAEKAKNALMEEATASVMSQFTVSKELKKAALEGAINKIRGKGGTDPVQAAFVDFFKKKVAAAKKSDDGTEEKAHRAAMVTKLNSVCKSEGFYFQFDESGKPKMTA